LSLLSSFDPTSREAQSALPAPLQQALAMFLFCYHARGMCFVDLAYLKKSDLRGDRIHYRRHKTSQPIEVRVVPVMRRIIEWFAPLTAGCKYLFPVIVDPDKDPRLQYESGLRLQNQRLKKIAALTGIGKHFSTHVARHSWATVAKNEGLPLAVISEGLGHSNQRTTEIYLASLEQPVLDRASQVVSDAIRPGQKSKKRSRGGLSAYNSYGLRYGRFW
jgi:integrase